MNGSQIIGGVTAGILGVIIIAGIYQLNNNSRTGGQAGVATDATKVSTTALGDLFK